MAVNGISPSTSTQGNKTPIKQELIDPHTEKAIFPSGASSGDKNVNTWTI